MTTRDRLRFSLTYDWKASDVHLTINASFCPKRSTHMSKNSMSVLLLSTSVQGPLLGNKPQNTNKGKMPWLCYATRCPQLRSWLWTNFFHVSTKRCSGSNPSRPSCYFLSSLPIPVWCPFFGFAVELSQKQHLIWRAHQSQSGWVSITQFKEHYKPGRCGWPYQQVKRKQDLMYHLYYDPMTILIIIVIVIILSFCLVELSIWGVNMSTLKLSTHW